MEYTLTIQDRYGFRHDSTRYGSIIEARRHALRKWRDNTKSVTVMKAGKYLSLNSAGWIEYTDRGFVWKVKKGPGKELNFDGTLVR